MTNLELKHCFMLTGTIILLSLFFCRLARKFSVKWLEIFFGEIFKIYRN